jgi:Zn finger protein HypA/HybF involved in hydrogenase expression
MMNRKQRRYITKATSQQATEELAQKVSQFNQLPEQCMTCEKSFDKRDKSMVQSWSVVVRQEAVRLFCPQCVKKTQEIIDEHSKT